jgi:hypothetical protein
VFGSFCIFLRAKQPATFVEEALGILQGTSCSFDYLHGSAGSVPFLRFTFRLYRHMLPLDAPILLISCGARGGLVRNSL